MRAGRVFTPNAGQRDARGLGIIVSMWGTLAATQLAITPPLLMQVLGRVFSYAGNHDLPQFVHRSGPYAYVRNPFYLSYLLAEISIVVIWPSVWGAMVVALAAAYFQWLARYEEGKFSRSPVAAEYAEYMARTGRLLPRLPLP